MRAVWLPLALHLRLASESSACTQHTTTLHGTAFLVIDCRTDALSNVDASERRWLTDCNTSGAWGSGHTGPARLTTRSAIAMIASGRILHACTARDDGGDTAIATDTALASHCFACCRGFIMVLHWFKCVQPKLNALPTRQCTNGNASEALLSSRATTDTPSGVRLKSHV